MRVQQVLMPDGAESWTVLGDDGEPVPAIEAFLSHLQALDRSPMTLRTYATSMKLWLLFLARIDVAADQAKIEHISRFVAWLRAPAENVTVLPGGTSRCSPATVNKHLAALFSFYDYQARNGVALAQSLVAWRRVNRGGYRSFLHHVTAGRPVATRPVRLRQERRLPRTHDRPAGAHPRGGLRPPAGPLLAGAARRDRDVLQGSACGWVSRFRSFPLLIS